MLTEEMLIGSTLGLGLGALVVFMFFTALMIILIVFLYKAFALYTIAKKLNSKYAFLAWIPVAQFFIYPILAKERWEWGFIALLPIVLPLLFLPFAIIPFVNYFLIILITVGVLTLILFRTYWIWKIFERRHYHGALSLITLINLGCLIILGIVAWKDRKSSKVKKTKFKVTNTKKVSIVKKKRIKKKVILKKKPISKKPILKKNKKK